MLNNSTAVPAEGQKLIT